MSLPPLLSILLHFFTFLLPVVHFPVSRIIFNSETSLWTTSHISPVTQTCINHSLDETPLPQRCPGSPLLYSQTVLPSIHPSGPYSVQNVGAACLSSLLGYWAQSWTGRHSDKGYQQAGTHFTDLGRMTCRVNPTWY